MSKFALGVLIGFLHLTGAYATEDPEIRSVVVMFNNGDVKLGYFRSDYSVDELGKVHIAKYEQGVLNSFELYNVAYPERMICKYSDGPISLSSVTAISLYRMQFDNLAASTPWTVVSRAAIVKLQSKPLAQYRYDRGGGCRVFMLSYNPDIKEKELETLFNNKVKVDVMPDEVKKLEKDNVYVIWRCWH